MLIRGVSGSGKTQFAEFIHTLARNMHDHYYNDVEATIVSADDFFTDKDGEYNFNPKNLSLAHGWCQNIVENAMQTEFWGEDGGYVDVRVLNLIIVHNTFTKEWEMEPYFDMAKEYEYEITTLIMENRHESKSIHDVPDNIIKGQKERFDIKL